MTRQRHSTDISTQPHGEQQPVGSPPSASDVTERALAIHAALTGSTRAQRAPDDRPDGRAPVALPDPEKLDGQLESVLMARRSRYHFAGEPLDLTTLSALLRFAAGLQRTRATPDTRRHPLSVAPAAGGLPTLQTHVLARDVDRLDPGVYHYDMPTHTLHVTTLGDPTTELSGIYIQREFADTAPVTLAVSANLDIAFSKYTLDHYRTVHVDAGILTQNLYLVSTALGLAACAVVGFHEDKLADALACTRGEIPIMLFPVGRRHRDDPIRS